MTVRAVIQGCGHYLPKRVVDNSEFERTLDTSDDWISSRSGLNADTLQTRMRPPLSWLHWQPKQP